MTHRDFIKTLGGATAVASWLFLESGEKVDRESIYKWYANDVAWKWRPLLVKMAKEKRVKLPEDFMPGVPA